MSSSSSFLSSFPFLSVASVASTMVMPRAPKVPSRIIAHYLLILRPTKRWPLLFGLTIP